MDFFFDVLKGQNSTMRYQLSLLLSIHAFSLLASGTVSQSHVTEVTLYRTYARETRVAQIQIPKGQSEVILPSIPMNIDENSLQAGSLSNVHILSISTRLNSFRKDSDENIRQIRLLQDSLKHLDSRIRFMGKQKEGYEAELNLLAVNNKPGGTTDGLQASQLRELLELNRIKQQEIRKLLFDNEEGSNELKNNVAICQRQLNEWNARNESHPVREIVLHVLADAGSTTSLQVSYLVLNAGWNPTYEIRCLNTNSPLLLSCRAKLFQNSGYDWKNIHLRLSTANPRQQQERPVLNPVYVDFMQPDYYRKRFEDYEVPSKNMMNSLPAAAPRQLKIVQEDQSFTPGLQVKDNDVTLVEGNLMTEYDIEQIQDIESDGQEHIIGIQEISLDAAYRYHAVPKLDNGVFLLAGVTDWGRYNLLAGEATLFLENMYVGKSYLNPLVSSDTLFISLGRDEQLQVRRIKQTELCTIKHFSGKRKETYAFEIDVKNNKKLAIEVEVMDQYPVTKNADIDVTLDECSNARVNSTYGSLIWRIPLQAGERKELHLQYSLRYPDDKKLSERNQ